MDKALHFGYKTTEHQKLQVLLPRGNRDRHEGGWECFIAVFPVYQIPLRVLIKGTKFSCYLQKYGSNKSPQGVFADTLIKYLGSQVLRWTNKQTMHLRLQQPSVSQFYGLVMSVVCASKASRSTGKGGQ